MISWSRRPNVIHLDRQLGHNLTLQAEVVVVNIRVADALRENNARQECSLRVAGCPTREIAHSLRASALAGVRGCAEEGRRGATRATYSAVRIAGAWAVNDDRVAAVQRRAIRQVEGVERRIPARVGEWVVERGLVGDPESLPTARMRGSKSWALPRPSGRRCV